MQDIVYKLVPNLQYNEMKRERDFYRRKGLPCPKAHNPGLLNEKDAGSKASSSKEDEADCHRSDEQVNILLESDSVQLKQMRRKFIRCSSQATITHLKKFIAKKLFNNLDRYKERRGYGLSRSWGLCPDGGREGQGVVSPVHGGYREEAPCRVRRHVHIRYVRVTLELAALSVDASLASTFVEFITHVLRYGVHLDLASDLGRE
ncbi:hypothetical protein HPB49_012935 [Dermacentor silvarum]|uniref:Uncharacterized protein n=1 Tax=Dermacentor silvarum TaxID=543639 RepID=A0ACB8E156_DERSI|nr:hypothetical protein HPB49_012935 [Dermacentor silvarum]